MSMAVCSNVTRKLLRHAQPAAQPRRARACAGPAPRGPAPLRAVAGPDTDVSDMAVPHAEGESEAYDAAEVDPAAAMEAEARLLTPADLKALEAKYAFDEAADIDTQELYEEFDKLLGTQASAFEVGDRVKGVCYKVEPRGAFVDIGAKAPAYLPLQEVAVNKPAKATDAVKAGDEHEFMVVQGADRDGMMVISIRKIEFEKLWATFRDLMAKDETVVGEVCQVNRGGSLVMVQGLRGFVPMSHMTPQYRAEEAIGEEVPLKFLEVDEERGRLVMSNRRAVVEQAKSAFAVGDVVEGIVSSVKPYGAFVDLGSTNGLLHISQISHDRINAVEDVLQPGDKLKVMVLSQDKDRGRISLSTKKLEPSPGDMLRDKAIVYDKADEMAATFKERIALAEEAARAEEDRLRAAAGAPEEPAAES